jgi:DNA-binding MarR family transcriptional regulator
VARADLPDRDYRALARFRRALRRFLAFSEQAAREAGVTPAQHQLLLAVRGHDGDGPPSTSDLAAALQLKVHSVVELIDRAERAGLVARHQDPADGRRQLVTLTDRGRDVLRGLAAAHRAELRRVRRELLDALRELDEA